MYIYGCIHTIYDYYDNNIILFKTLFLFEKRTIIIIFIIFISRFQQKQKKNRY